VASPAYGLLGLRLSLRLRFTSENASLFALYVCASTHGPTSLSCELGLFSLGIVTVHTFSFQSLASRVHVAGDVYETIWFVVGVLTTSFALALLGLIH